MSDLAFRFKLRDVGDIEPWGPAGKQNLSWFGLTDGCYCIDTPAGKLFEHTGPVGRNLLLPWCDYQVARLLEDVIEIWPAISDPVPDDIIDYYQNWFAHKGAFDKIPSSKIDLSEAVQSWIISQNQLAGSDLSSPIFDALEVANSWCYARSLDTFYLNGKPGLQMWRTGPSVHLKWDAGPPWVVSKANLTFEFDLVKTAVSDFINEFMREMQSRVDAIQKDGWTRRDCIVDVDPLVEEQIERKHFAEGAISKVVSTD